MAKTKILIVEDEAIIAYDTKVKLELEGYEIVDIVGTGQAAIKYTDIHKPDLVVMDIVLNGEMNGIEAAEKILAGHKIPILFLSAHSEKTLLRQVESNDLYNYLIKPVSAEELFQAVIQALNVSNG
ncbi:response regulator [candidate division KSB1 bacterium]|nr:response regulator [candidate division KSB1 bacterium]